MYVASRAACCALALATPGAFPWSRSDEEYCLKLFFDRQGLDAELAGTLRMWKVREQYVDHVAGAIAVVDMQGERDNGALDELCRDVMNRIFIDGERIHGGVWLQRCAGGSLVDAVSGIG